MLSLSNAFNKDDLDWLINDSDVFWEEQAEEFITWFSKWDIIQEWNFSDITISWFKNAKLNVSYNCIDRHLEKRGDQIAIIWEGDNPDDQKYITYRELHEEVCKFSNVLKSRGIKKGDCIYYDGVAGHDIAYNDTMYRVIRARDIVIVE